MCRPASQPLSVRGACVSTGTNALLLSGLVGGAHGGLGRHCDWALRALDWSGLRRIDDVASSSPPFLTWAFDGAIGCGCRASYLAQVGEGSGGSGGVCPGVLQFVPLPSARERRMTLTAFTSDSTLCLAASGGTDGRPRERPLPRGAVLAEVPRLARAQEDGLASARGSASARLDGRGGARVGPVRRLLPPRSCRGAERHPEAGGGEGANGHVVMGLRRLLIVVRRRTCAGVRMAAVRGGSALECFVTTTPLTPGWRRSTTPEAGCAPAEVGALRRQLVSLAGWMTTVGGGLARLVWTPRPDEQASLGFEDVARRGEGQGPRTHFSRLNAVLAFPWQEESAEAGRARVLDPRPPGGGAGRWQGGQGPCGGPRVLPALAQVARRGRPPPAILQHHTPSACGRSATLSGRGGRHCCSTAPPPPPWVRYTTHLRKGCPWPTREFAGVRAGVQRRAEPGSCTTVRARGGCPC